MPARKRKETAELETTEEKPERRRQGSFFDPAKADERRVRVAGAIRTTTQESLSPGDTVEMRIVGHVKRTSFDLHKDGGTVVEHVLDVEEAKIV